MLDGPVDPRTGYTGCYDLHALDAPLEMQVAYIQYVQSINYDRFARGMDVSAPRPFDATWRDLYRRASQPERAPELEELVVEEELGDQPAVAEERPTPDTVTIGSCSLSQRAFKRYAMDDVGEVSAEPYDVGTLITASAVDVENLSKLRDLLVWLESQPTRWVMRGGAREGVDLKRPHRRIYRDDHEHAPTYQPEDRYWVMHDVDQVEWPRGVEPGDGDACARYVLEQLPACFHDVGCVWQWSNSAGVGGWDKIKMHLWFWLDRPVCDYSWREWVKKSATMLDTAPFNPVQPHYTASPEFDGVEDPLQDKARTGLIQGPVMTAPRELVTLDEWRELTAAVERRRKAARERDRAARSSRGQARGYAAAALRRACEAIRGAGEGIRHETIRAESLATSRFVTQGELDEATWRDELKRAAVDVLPSSRWADVDRLLNGALRIEGAA